MLCIPPNALNQDRELNVFCEEIPRMVVFTRSQTRSETRCTVVAADDKQCTRPYEKEFYEYSETSLRICSEHLKHMDELRQDRKSLETVTLNNTGPLTDDKIAIIKAYLIQRAASSSSSPDKPSTPANSDIPPKDSGKKRRADEDPPRDTQTMLQELTEANRNIKRLEGNILAMRQALSMLGNGLAGTVNFEKDKSKALSVDINEAKSEIQRLHCMVSELTQELEKSRNVNHSDPFVNMKTLPPDEVQKWQKALTQRGNDVERLSQDFITDHVNDLLEKFGI